MKKFFTALACLMICAITATSFIACNNKTVTPPSGGWQNPPQDTDRAHYDDATTLVVYFSMPETTDPDNMTTEEANSTVVINGKVLGNTQYMAYVIQDTAGANIFRIIPETPYPTDHDTLVDQAKDEQGEGARPAIRDAIPADEFAQYDTVFVGYPNWWGDMPMIMYTFFETYDFSGKTIIPFNTHGGSGFSNTRNTIRALEPNAVVDDGLSISRNNIQDAEQQIVNWVKTFNLTPGTTPSEPETPTEQSDILIVYFSATSNTERIAGYIAEATNGKIFEIIPVNPYTNADLNYGDPNSRVSREHNDVSLRDIALTSTVVDEWSAYDTVFIGYPIWWGIAAWPINGFITANDFTGKTVIPFCSSASSGLGQSGELLAGMAGSGNWLEGMRFRSGATQSDVNNWLNGLGL